jgi:pyruvate dehydrogenase (quinone)
MIKSAAGRFAERLDTARVKRIFGIAGDSLNGRTDPVRRLGGTEWVHVRHDALLGLAEPIFRRFS